jgi:hypothetical protein
MASLRKKNLSPIRVSHIFVELTIVAKPLSSQGPVSLIVPHCSDLLVLHVAQNVSSSNIVAAWNHVPIPKNSHVTMQGAAPVMLRFQIMLGGKLEIFSENNFGRFRIHHNPDGQIFIAD